MLDSEEVAASEMTQVLSSWLGRLRPTDCDPPVELVVDCPVAARRVGSLLGRPGIVLTSRRELEARALHGAPIRRSEHGAPGEFAAGSAERVPELLRLELRRARRLQLVAEGGHFDALREQVPLLRLLLDLDWWLPPSAAGGLADACRAIGLDIAGRAGREALALLDRARPERPGEDASAADEHPLVVGAPGRLLPAVRDYLRRRPGRTVLLEADPRVPHPLDPPAPLAFEDVPAWWAGVVTVEPSEPAVVEAGDRLAALRLGGMLDAAGVPWLGWSGRTLADSAVGRLVRRALGAAGRPPEPGELLGPLSGLVPERTRAGLVARVSPPLRAVVGLGRSQRRTPAARAGSLLAALASALGGGLEELSSSLGDTGLYLPSDGLWPKGAPDTAADLARERFVAGVLSVLGDVLRGEESQPERRVSRGELVTLVELALGEECWWDRTATRPEGGPRGGGGLPLLVVPPMAWPGPGVGATAVVASGFDRRPGAAERGTGLGGDDALLRLFGRDALDRLTGSTGATGRRPGRPSSPAGASPPERSADRSDPIGASLATGRSRRRWLVERLSELGHQPRRERLALLAAEALEREGDPALAGGLRSLAARAGSELTRFEGDLTARAPIRLVAPGQALAIRALDDYRACPRRFLVEHVLGIALEALDPDDLELSPAERGRLVHALLADALEAEVEEAETLVVGAEGTADRAPVAGTPGQPAEADAARAVLAGDGSAGDGSAGDGSAGDGSAGDGSAGDEDAGEGDSGDEDAEYVVDERPLDVRTRRALELLGPGDPLWEALRVRQARRLAAQVERVLKLDRHRWRRPGQRPVALEFEIGSPSGPGDRRRRPGDRRQGDIVLGGGGDVEVRLSGRLDRVDRVGEGTYVVIDYKTGHPAPYRRERRVDLGLLQLPLYGEALSRRLGVGPPALGLPPSAAAPSEGRDVRSHAPSATLDGRLVGEYWLVDPRDRPDVVVLELDAERRGLALRLAEAVVAAAADGLFPPSPDDHHHLPQPCPLCRMSEGWGGPPARRLAGAAATVSLLARLRVGISDETAGSGAPPPAERRPSVSWLGDRLGVDTELGPGRDTPGGGLGTAD